MFFFQRMEMHARMIMEYENVLFNAIGIPRGVRTGRWLNEYSTANPDHPYLIVDDVLTTGGSMDEYKEEHFDEKNLWMGRFARKKTTTLGRSFRCRTNELRRSSKTVDTNYGHEMNSENSEENCQSRDTIFNTLKQIHKPWHQRSTNNVEEHSGTILFDLT